MSGRVKHNESGCGRLLIDTSERRGLVGSGLKSSHLLKSGNHTPRQFSKKLDCFLKIVSEHGSSLLLKLGIEGVSSMSDSKNLRN